MYLISILVLVVPIAVIMSMSRNQRRISAVRSATVELRADELGVTRVMADGREESIDWGEVNEVEIVRASKGAHAAYGGVLVLGCDDTRGCLIPLDRLDDTGIRDALGRLLPQFDKGKMEAAMLKRPPSRTTCWLRPGYEPDEPSAS